MPERPSMTLQILIDSLVRQVTVLIAQLSTAGGVRAPLAHIANQVFVQLARELDAQGVSRKVSADMFGMALRAYVRKVRRLDEAQGEPGVTVWQAVLDFIRSQGLVRKSRVLERFSREDELQLAGVMHDLLQSGLVFVSGSNEQAVYRASTELELGELAQLSSEEGLVELVWVLVYREGPLTEAELAARVTRKLDDLHAALEVLTTDGRVRRLADGRLEAIDFVVPRGAEAGWEAAVFDHVQAVVQTICQRLQQATQKPVLPSAETPQAPAQPPVIGGSTYSFDLGPEHPLAGEVKGQLEALRQRLGELRLRVDAHNREAGLPAEYEQVVTYVGQCILEKEQGNGASHDQDTK
jgi:hypothetical protein